MLTKAQAQAHADNMTDLHGEPWIVFRVPDNALSNQKPYNLHNTGRYYACPAAERAEYEAAGAVFE